MNPFKVIIVEDVPLELKGTLGIVKNDIPEAEIIGTAENEPAYWRLVKQQLPDLVLLDLGLGGSTTVGVEICRHTKESYPHVKVLIFTGEILNEKLWVDVLDAGADGIILKSGELLTRGDVASVMDASLLFIGMQIVDVDDAQLESPHDQTGGIDANAHIAVGKEFLYEFVLTLLQALHAKGHAAKVGNLLLRES